MQAKHEGTFTGEELRVLKKGANARGFNQPQFNKLLNAFADEKLTPRMKAKINRVK